MEEEVIFFILQMVYPRHETRSAFTSGSVRGWVYLEATMNSHLQRLLRLTPGIIHDCCGICLQHIPLNEGLELLKMHPQDPPELGKWVQVQRGAYKGDIGYVLSVAASEVHLLLIPRLAPDTSRSKRKRSQPRIPLKLFDHEIYNAIKPRRISENIYSVGNDRFEHGLIVRSYGFDVVSTGISTIPLESFNLFRASGHPQLTSSKSAFPRPSEWSLLEGDEVYNLDDPITTTWPYSYKSGFISKLRDDAAELDTKEGIVVVPWIAICKVVRIGDFVEVIAGLHKEQKGWVDEINLSIEVANIIRMVDKGKQISDHVEVLSILNEWSPHAHVPVRRSKYQSIY